MTKPADIARENARKKNGTFGTQLLDESNVDPLDGPESVECPQCFSVESSEVIEALGQCASCQNDEDEREAGMEIERREQEAMWGSVDVTAGSRSPWGEAQHVDQPAPGIAFASTPGHGGFKLSKERNAAIPAALRNKSGWYEEDVEANIVGMVHPEAFPHVVDKIGESGSKAYFEGTVMSSFPDQYTAATGREVPVALSRVLQDRAKRQSTAEFRAAHANEFVTLGNGDNFSNWIPKGYAACEARLDATGEIRTFLMPRDEVIHDKSYGRNALVDPNRHLDVTDVVNSQPDRPWPYAERTVPAQHGDDLCIDYHRLSTPTQVARARHELEKVWHFANADGSFVTESLGDHFKRLGVTGKIPRMDGDKVTYNVSMAGGFTRSVSKATYDAMTSVPDVSTPVDRAYVEKEKARVKHEKARKNTYGGLDTGGMAKVRSTDAEHKAAAAEYKALSDAQSEDARAWQAERDQMQAAAFKALATERGINSFDE